LRAASAWAAGLLASALLRFQLGLCSFPFCDVRFDTQRSLQPVVPLHFAWRSDSTRTAQLPPGLALLLPGLACALGGFALGIRFVREGPGATAP